MVGVVCFDLDDTLYKEIDYLKSAFQEVARYAAECCGKTSDPVSILAAKAYNEMLNTYLSGGNAFQRLNEFLGLNVPVADYLTIYREHKPTISLDEDAIKTLNWLKDNDFIIGLITDGRVNSQTAKIEALGLYRWIKPEDVVISESFGSTKPDERNYRYFVDKYGKGSYCYIGDNTEKDFIAPNALGWKTICLKEDSDNVHRQNFSVEKEKMPHHVVSTLFECIERL